jgi:serine/threonine protein kinase
MEESKTPQERNQKMMLNTPKKTWKNVLQEKNVQYDSENISHGKFGEVIIGKVSPFKFSSPNIALKTQFITKPKDLSDTSYRELLIFQELTKLKEDCSIPGFIGIYDWFKTQGNLDEREENPYMNLILEKADITLKKYLSNQNYQISCDEYKNILFQILYALSFSQDKCQFMHHDLHLDNIMLKYLPKENQKTKFKFEETNFFIKTNYLIKITDFGLSRITNTLSNEVIFHPKKGYFFDSSVDVNQIGMEFKKIKIIWKEDELEEKTVLSNLKRKMNKNITNATELLSHPFFDSLKNEEELKESFLQFGVKPTFQEEDFPDLSRNVTTIIKTRKNRIKKF